MGKAHSNNWAWSAGRGALTQDTHGKPPPPCTCSSVLAKDVMHPAEGVVLGQGVIARHRPAGTADTLAWSAPPSPPHPTAHLLASADFVGTRPCERAAESCLLGSRGDEVSGDMCRDSMLALRLACEELARLPSP